MRTETTTATRANALWHCGAWLVLAVLMLTACRPERMAYSKAVALPDEGWERTMPITFAPQYGDSTARYDIDLAVRHTPAYEFSTLTLVVDIVDEQAHTSRKRLELPLADSQGNWLGAGFGTLYQHRITLARDVDPRQVRSIVVWQATTDSTALRNVSELSIFAKPK